MPLRTEEFHTDPHGFYQQVREQFGPLAPVVLAGGVPATLVTGYSKALAILHDEFHSADPRPWQKDAPIGCPVRPVLEWRPTAARSAGADHDRYRRVIVEVVDGVNLHAVRARVEHTAVGLINLFCQRGQVDLRSEYAVPLVYTALGRILGVPDEMNDQLYRAVIEHIAATDAHAAKHGYDLTVAMLAETVSRKKTTPADDVTTRLIHHPAALTDDEIAHQLATLYFCGAEPTVSLLLNTLRLLIDHRLTGDVLGGALGARDALEETLFLDPPVANGCLRYPAATRLDGIWLPAHQPVVIAIAATNADPALHTTERVGNRAHLAWGAGKHQCPASALALLIAGSALDQLLDALPVMQPAVPVEQLSWFPTPFLRALTALPVTFTPAPPLHHL
ncbi:cytochrome P450 [Nocardia paucivorans]|uniref:cytochrome P450 n=1 Tax=Nocardia paucivorans TaxID=114259 RepID=UPI001FDF631B|nr:cytochrome P450 [Nocardia paucivorans]